ncbi:YjfA family protein [Streptomyces sp. Tue 6430]|nr:YjfA family protein [Streptomyces sp. Tue 6430]
MAAAPDLRPSDDAGLLDTGLPDTGSGPRLPGRGVRREGPRPHVCGLPGRADALGPPHRTRTGAHVEIRYSTVCAAAWGRVWHARVGDAVEVSAPGAPPRRVVVRTTADTGVYRFTPMLGGDHRTDLRLCFLPADGTARECYRP